MVRAPEQPPTENPTPFAPTFVKGSLAEVMVLTDVVKRGYCASIPYCQDSPYDLIVDRNGVLARVQIKHAVRMGEGAIQFNCCSSSRVYTEKTIDWIAAYDSVGCQCYYVPAKLLGAGRKCMTLRLKMAKNQQKESINWAHEFTEF